MDETDGMIGGEDVMGEYANATTSIDRGSEYNVTEHCFIDVVRARTSQQQASSWHFGECLAIDLAVAFPGVIDVRFFLRKCWWIEDDKIIIECIGSEEIERIGLEKSMLLERDPIDLEVSTRCLDARSRDIERIYSGRPLHRCIERKSSGVAKCIQQTSTSSIFPDECTHFSLIKEETCFLPHFDIDDKFHIILENDHLAHLFSLDKS
jgi:hypothetical protein